MTTITKKIHFVTRSRRKCITTTAAPKPEIPLRIPRVSKLMALAIRFDQLVRDGIVDDFSQLARLAHVTQPRMTQIMNLLHLAPDIQEEILYLPPVPEGRDLIHEKMLRPLCSEVRWREQREAWRTLRAE